MAAAAAAARAESPPLPGPPGGRPRPVCSRPYFLVLMVFAHLYVLNVLGLLLFVHLSAGDTGGPPAAPPPPPPPARALPRLEGIKVGHTQRVELVPGRVHAVRTLSLKPLLFASRHLDCIDISASNCEAEMIINFEEEN
ncbi:transmembrane prolyl 4-hydroxylase [Grus japonensis]|uniref:Transmembrane prolyl 4-hydroxylase n=1 Tax=Grus japonensis TaxID=30415 RepID=A0ABC9X9X7_GRUJA